MSSRPPKCPKYLHDHSIPNATREELDIDELVLIGEYNKWSIGYFLNSYSLLSATFDATGHNLYTKILQSLNALKEYEPFNQRLKRFLQKFYNYFKQNSVKLDFLIRYKQLEQDRRSSQAKQDLEREVSITCDEVVAHSLAESSRKRKSEANLLELTPNTILTSLSPQYCHAS